MLKEDYLLCRVFYGNLIINVSIAKFEGLLTGQFQEANFNKLGRGHSRPRVREWGVPIRTTWSNYFYLP